MNDAVWRAGVLDLSTAGWSAGGSYTDTLARSLGAVAHEVRGEVFYFSDQDKAARAREERWPVKVVGLPAYRATSFEDLLRRRLRLEVRTRPFFGERRLRRALPFLQDESDSVAAARFAGMDAILPLTDLSRFPRLKSVTVGWIPDFQHVHLPQNFSKRERDWRDAAYMRLATHADRVMLSSEQAKQDFCDFAPGAARKAFTSSFPSRFAFDAPIEAASDPLGKYHLPRKYLLIANQVWAHKNLATAVRAVGVAARHHADLHLVLVGKPLDGRSPSNAPTTQLLQEIAAVNARSNISPLGEVSFDDLTVLLRGAAAVIQPSAFEGWNTTVQDAVALGKRLFLSDIPVHRQQAPRADFFGLQDYQALADVLVREWPLLPEGINAAVESVALEEHRAFAEEHGRRLWRAVMQSSGRRLAPTVTTILTT